MSLIEVLCWLRDELPLTHRQAPKRVLLERYLAHEHALLQLPSASDAAPDNTPGQGRLSHTEAQQELSSVVEVMFRKARLKRCLHHLSRQQQSGDKNKMEVLAPSQSELFLQRPGVGDLDARVERRIPNEPAEPPSQLEELHPRRADDIVEQRSQEQSAPAEDPPPPREEGEDEAERVRRRILLRRFFQAARRRDFVGRNDQVDLGQGGTPAAAGAPCCTVGGSRLSSAGSLRLSGHHVLDGGLRRANLLRRILHALRESARERVLAAPPSTASPPCPAPQDHLPRPLPLATPRSQNEPPPVPVGPRSHSTTYPERVPAGTAAARGDVPVHPRQATRTGNAHQAVFKALAALLPSCPIGEVPSGGGGGAGARGGIGRMQAAAMRCGVQCQGYIRALQNGIEVSRPGASGEDIRSRLTLQAAGTDGAGVALALHDIDVSREAATPAGVRREGVPSTPLRAPAPASMLLPLARVTRVRCLSGSTSSESLSFVVLAAGALGVNSEGGTACPQVGVAQPLLAAGEVEPFGVLRATSAEDFRALVLGVASVKSALDSPFRTRIAPPHLATQGPRPTAIPPFGSPSSEPPATAASSPAAAATASNTAAAATAAACLPWQGARVCIVELAPSLTFLGAVRAVEEEARRVGRENGVNLRDQNLLICADLQ